MNGPDQTTGTNATTATQQANPAPAQDVLEFRSQLQAPQTTTYQAPANKPTLSPTVQLPPPPAGASQAPANTSNQQQAEFMSMVNQLPAGLRSSLLKDMAKPLAQRNPQLTGLESTLNKAATVATWAKQINQGNAQMSNVPAGLQSQVAQSLQGGGQPSAQLQTLMGKASLTPQDAQMLKSLAQTPGAVSPQQFAAINAKLQQGGFGTVTPPSGAGLAATGAAGGAVPMGKPGGQLMESCLPL